MYFTDYDSDFFSAVLWWLMLIFITLIMTALSCSPPVFQGNGVMASSIWSWMVQRSGRAILRSYRIDQFFFDLLSHQMNLILCRRWLTSSTWGTTWAFLLIEVEFNVPSKQFLNSGLKIPEVLPVQSGFDLHSSSKPTLYSALPVSNIQSHVSMSIFKADGTKPWPSVKQPSSKTTRTCAWHLDRLFPLHPTTRGYGLRRTFFRYCPAHHVT